MVTWFCKSAERVDALMHKPGIGFMHGMMLSVAKGECGVGLHGTSFVFMPEGVAGQGESSEGQKFLILKGKLFPRIEGGIEAYAPFDEKSFKQKSDDRKAKPAKGRAI